LTQIVVWHPERYEIDFLHTWTPTGLGCGRAPELCRRWQVPYVARKPEMERSSEVVCANLIDYTVEWADAALYTVEI